jgi:hypothetical protein
VRGRGSLVQRWLAVRAEGLSFALALCLTSVWYDVDRGVTGWVGWDVVSLVGDEGGEEVNR